MTETRDRAARPKGLLRCRAPHPDPALRLICLPWAGSGALGFAPWRLPADLAVEIWAVQLPGRDDRAREVPFRRTPDVVAALREALRPLLDRPVAFFGHSMGALLAFELARSLRRHSDPAPSQLFLSGIRAPHLPPWRPPASTLPDEDLLRRLDEMAGPSRQALRDRELLLWLAPALRADFEVCETYRHVPEPPLDIPVTLLAATDDAEVRADEVEAWAQHFTAAGPPHLFDGGHLYLLDRRDEVLDLLAAELSLPHAHRL